MRSVVYVDSSALVKLVLPEPERQALRTFLYRSAPVVSCALARVEVSRATRPHGRDAVRAAREVVATTDFIGVDDAMLDDAATIGPATLRTLDAIHLAAALTLGAELEALVTYDRRLADAARSLGIEVRAPA